MRPFSLVIRADEQEKLDSNSTVVVNGQNVTRELDIDFYLGIYGGNLKTPTLAQRACCTACHLELRRRSCFSGFPGLTLATIFFGFIRNLFLFTVLVRCAQSLHNRMFKALLGTPVRFFDINPIGKLVTIDY